jgi:hypothetical protein
MDCPGQYAAWHNLPQEAYMDAQLELMKFTAADRCDRCGAQAYHVARHEGRSDLYFCKHHMRDHKDALLDTGWKIISDQEAIDALTGNDTIDVKY